MIFTTIASGQCERSVIDDVVGNERILDNDVFLETLFGKQSCIQTDSDRVEFYKHASYAINNWQHADHISKYEKLYSTLLDSVRFYLPDLNDSSRVITEVYIRLFLQRQYQNFGFYEKSNKQLDSIYSLLHNPLQNNWEMEDLLLNQGIEKAKYLKKANQYNAAIDQYLELIEWIKERETILQKSGRLAKFNAYIGDCYMNIGDLATARKFYKKGRENIKGLDQLEEQQAHVMLCQKMADLLLKLNKPDSAFFVLSQSQLERFGALEDRLISLRLESNIYAMQGNVNKAIKLIRDHVSLCWKENQAYNDENVLGLKTWKSFLQSNKDKDEFNSFISRLVVAQVGINLDSILIGQALSEQLDLIKIIGEYYLEVFQKKGNVEHLELANEYLRRGIEIQDLLQSQFIFEDDVIEDVNNRYAIFEKAVYALYLLDSIQNDFHYDRFFELFEGSKSKILLEAVAQKNSLKKADVPDSLLTKMFILKSLIKEFEYNFPQVFLMENDQGTEQQRQFILLKGEYQSLLERINDNYGTHFTKQIIQEKVPLYELQNGMNDSTSLLSFIGTSERMFVLHVTKEGVNLGVIRDVYLILEKLQKLYGLIQLSEWTENEKEEYINNAFFVYNQLIGQHEFNLKSNICIAPESIIAEFPFAALITEIPGEKTPLQKLPFMIKKHAVFYNYSATLWELLGTRDVSNNQYPICAFAPEFGNNEVYSPLVFSLEEIKYAQEALGGITYEQGNSSKQTFYESCRSCDVIHLSTHGQSLGKEEDYIVFQTAEVYEKLSLSEVYNLNFNTELIVLSACETGIGPEKKGEGVISLARGFLYAGVNTVLTTLWKISDSGTFKFSQAFYDGIKAGNSRNQATNQAQLHLLENTKFNHPYYWAGFTLIGEADPIKKDKLSPWKIIFFPVVVLGIIVIWQVFKKRTQNSGTFF